jgi:holo-[acyl-carrier protein] synthase
MILGLGNDLVDIRRIEKIVTRFGERFTQKVFTENELLLATAKKGQGDGYVRALATRFAGKEATAKALGTGIADGVYWQNIEILSLQSGQPVVYLNGGAKLRLQGLLSSSVDNTISITISDEYPIVSAIVIISSN